MQTGCLKHQSVVLVVRNVKDFEDSVRLIGLENI